MEGTSIPFDNGNIAKFTDMARIQKIYKLPSSAARDNVRSSKKRSVKGEKDNDISHIDGIIDDQDNIAERKKMEAMVLGAMALRGAT